MNEFNDTSEIATSNVSDKKLLIGIWTKPTDTLAYILENCPEKYVFPLLVLGGIVRAVTRASFKDMGDEMPTMAVLGLAVVAGGLLGWITYFIYAWGMSVTGKWLNGEAESAKFRTIIAWALIPSICTLILLIPEIIVFGDDLFKSEPVNESTFNNTMWIVFGIVEMILSIWTITILVKGISLIQDFSVGKSILRCYQAQ